MEIYIEVYPNPIADFEPKPRKATIALPRIRFANLSKFVTDSTQWEWKFGDPLNGTSTTKIPHTGIQIQIQEPISYS